MDLYDKQYVYFEWDDSLEGKEGFFADYIDTLVVRVNDNNHRGKTVDKQHFFGHCSYGYSAYPFSVNSTRPPFMFFYYDPNYECKRAWKNGKQIQSKSKVYIDAEWVDDDYPDWNNSCEEFRIKPEELKMKRRMTNREFAKWLAQGNGQAKNTDGGYITSRGVEYDIGDDDKPCPDWLVIRGWDETEWHAPEVEE